MRLTISLSVYKLTHKKIPLHILRKLVKTKASLLFLFLSSSQTYTTHKQMAQLSLSILLPLLVSTYLAGAMAGPVDHSRSRAKAFVEAQCRATQYPQLCVQCLSNYVKGTSQSAQQLAQVALMVSLVRAQHTRAYVTQVAAEMEKMKSRDYPAVNDCLSQINDGVQKIGESIKELRRINQGGEDSFLWHTSNVQTWVSTALTDASLCIDGFSGRAMGGKVKATIKAKVLNVVQVTSNALGLFNRFAAMHRPRGSASKP